MRHVPQVNLNMEDDTMADLRKAMTIPGAFAAGEFSDGGELLNYVGDITLQAAKIAAQMCAANKLMGKMQAPRAGLPIPVRMGSSRA